MALMLASAALAAIRRHAGAAYPEECCGLLVGDRATSVSRVTGVVAVANRSAAPRHGYELDLSPLAAGLEVQRRGGPAVLGVYHSHPNGEAVPSGRDVREAWPGWSYLIVAVAESACGEARSFLRVAAGAPLVEEAVSVST